MSSNSVSQSTTQAALVNQLLQQQQAGNTTGAQQTAQEALQNYSEQSPGKSVQDFENSVSSTQSPANAKMINNVVNSVLPQGTEPAGVSASQAASQAVTGTSETTSGHSSKQGVQGGGKSGGGGGGGAGGAGSSSTQELVLDPSTGQYIMQTVSQ